MKLPYFPYAAHPYLMVPRQYPEVNVSRMQASAETFHQLAQQARNLTMKIQSDTTFAKRLNGAAQVNDKNEVKRLIKMVIGIPFDISYSPDGLKVTLHPSQQQACSLLTVFVCW